jgi:hypothetical protein
VERLAEELRRRVGLTDEAPPSAVAEALGHRVVVTEDLPPWTHAHCVVGERVIVVSAFAYVPRRERAIAHELLELHLQDWLDGDDLEQAAQRGAAALLVPAREFVASIVPYRLDLMKMREAFPWASCEVIGRRFVDLLPQAAFGVWDTEEGGYRRAACKVTEAETDVLRTVRRGATYSVTRRDGWTAQAWRSLRRPQRSMTLAVGA